MSKTICLIGTDGSGKSTLARELSILFSSKKYRPKIIWIRGSHGLASLLSIILGKFKLFQGDCNPYYRICIPMKLRPLWVIVEFISIIPIIIRRFIINSFKYDTIIADRCLLDFLAWIIVTLRVNVFKSYISRIILSLHYRLCDYTFYIKVDKATLKERLSNQRDIRFSMRFLQVYELLNSVLGFYTVNTSNRKVEDSLRLIQEKIGMMHHE